MLLIACLLIAQYSSVMQIGCSVMYCRNRYFLGVCHFFTFMLKWEHFDLCYANFTRSFCLFLSFTQQSKKHANKVRLFYMLHPEDGGPPSKRLRPDNPVFS